MNQKFMFNSTDRRIALLNLLKDLSFDDANHDGNVITTKIMERDKSVKIIRYLTFYSLCIYSKLYF